MKRNAFTPVHTTPRVSDINGYACIHTDGIESMLNRECDWLIDDHKNIKTLLSYHNYGYSDTDYAYALYKSKLKDLEFIRVDMAIYSYIMEGWC